MQIYVFAKGVTATEGGMNMRKAMKTKLDEGYKQILRLVARDCDEHGWATVSSTLYPVISKQMPPELLDFEKNDNGCRARLTDAGQEVVNAMAWI